MVGLAKDVDFSDSNKKTMLQPFVSIKLQSYIFMTATKKKYIHFQLSPHLYDSRDPIYTPYTSYDGRGSRSPVDFFPGFALHIWNNFSNCFGFVVMWSPGWGYQRDWGKVGLGSMGCFFFGRSGWLLVVSCWLFFLGGLRSFNFAERDSLYFLIVFVWVCL